MLSSYYRDLHKNIEDIPDDYRRMSLHIALENADIRKDWENFKKLYKLAPEFLKKHLDITGLIFDYNYKTLSKKEKNNLFI